MVGVAFLHICYQWQDNFVKKVVCSSSKCKTSDVLSLTHWTWVDLCFKNVVGCLMSAVLQESLQFLDLQRLASLIFISILYH